MNAEQPNQNPFANPIVGLPTNTYFTRDTRADSFTDNFLAQLGYTYAPIYDTFSEQSSCRNC